MEHELLTKHQSDNRKWFSTETLDHYFLDLSKALDSVQHNILLK